ncbi:MAG: WD40 repeat domain-containing protein [Mastigocoleus sp.]
MDWISLLKAQQADFLKRIKKTKTKNLCLLGNQTKGCHSEITTVSGESLVEQLQLVYQQAEIIAKNPPPTPPDYPEFVEWGIPFDKYFQQQTESYLLREQIVEQVINQRLGKLVKKVPQDTLKNMVLDDEGNLRSESKFPYVVADNSNINILVYATEGGSFNGIKKDKIRWSVTQTDLQNYQLLIFLCLFIPSNNKRSDEKKILLTGFIPVSHLELIDIRMPIAPHNLLYGGGLNWYLESLAIQRNLSLQLEETANLETVQTLAADHPLKDIVCDWECWQTLRGHTRGINCIAFTPGANSTQNPPLLASGSRGETKLWDLTRGELIATFSEYPWIISGKVDEINSLKFSPDGQILATAGADSTMKIWHVGAQELIDILHKHNGIVRCLAFTKNGKILATGGDDRRILFWDLIERQARFSLSLEDTAAHALTFSSDGQIMLTGSYRKIKVWLLSNFNVDNINNGNGNKDFNIQLIHSFTAHSHVVRALAITEDNKFFISGSRDKTIKIWDLSSGKLKHTLKGHTDGVYAIALSPDGQIIASGSADKTIKLWHFDTGELLGTFIGHNSTVTALVFTVSGDILVSGSLDKTIKIWQKN